MIMYLAKAMSFQLSSDLVMVTKPIPQRVSSRAPFPDGFAVGKGARGLGGAKPPQPQFPLPVPEALGRGLGGNAIKLRLCKVMVN